MFICVHIVLCNIPNMYSNTAILFVKNSDSDELSLHVDIV